MPKSLDGQHSPFDSSDEGKPLPNPTRKGKKPRGRRLQGTADWAPAFIGALMEGASIVGASRIADVDPSVPYMRRRNDEEFKRAWQEAADIGTEFLEQEAARRAFHGTLKPVFHKGVKCGVVREYSDTLMIFLLKARKPEKYRDGVEEGARGSFVLNVNVVQVDGPPAHVQAQLTESLSEVDYEVVENDAGDECDQQDDSGVR